MKNQFLRMLLYSTILLVLLSWHKLNFYILATLYFLFMVIEVFLNSKEYKKESKYIVLGYRILFILTAVIIIFNRDKIMG